MIRGMSICLAAGLAASPLDDALPELDVALVIAVDTSASMTGPEHSLQRDGFAQAFRSHRVHQAIRQGAVGRIAVAYVEWADAHRQHLRIPWMVIATPEDALRLADLISALDQDDGNYTSISGAISYAMTLFDSAPGRPVRRVIDISGDGTNNDGRVVAAARDEAVAAGITINGLPIMTKPPAWDFPNPHVNWSRAYQGWDAEHLDTYYRKCVIGGVGAFMVPVREAAEFVEAVTSKIVREVAMISPQAPLLRASTSPRLDCLEGERRRFAVEPGMDGQ